MAFADDSHRTTVVSAPAGYGKTTLLGDWSRFSDGVCAWLSLDPSDDTPAELYRWIVSAFQRVASDLSGPARSALESLDPAPDEDPAQDYREVVMALELLRDPMSLVVDNLHLSGHQLDGGILGTLIRSAPPRLHLVLSLRGDPALSLATQRLLGTVTDIGADDLAFTNEETCDLLLAHGINGTLEGTGLWRMTGGWPVATTEGMALRNEGLTPAQAFLPEPRRAFSDYVAEEVLARCPAPVADFILRATTLDIVSGPLANELNGNADGAMLLEHCLHERIFLKAERGSGSEAEYRWQPLFAATCRAILSHRDPLRARALHGAAARYYQDVDVSICVSEALLGHEPRTAVESIARHWLATILGGETASLERLCLGLPLPWSEDPEIVLVRSACRSIDGDPLLAAELCSRATAGARALSSSRRARFKMNLTLFELYVLGNRDPGATTIQVLDLIDRASEHPPTTVAMGLFLLGRAETRSPRPGRTATELLQAAAAAGKANGLTTVEVCAGAEFTLALAVNGDFAAAEVQGTATLERAEASTWSHQERLAPVWVARGVAGYWQNDLDRADMDLSKALSAGSSPFPDDSLAIVYRVLVDCATGDSDGIAASGAALGVLDAQMRESQPWPALGVVAAAKLREAEGDLEGAAMMVRPLAKGGFSPLADVLVAELLRTAGEHERALVCVGAFAGENNPPYVEASGALTEALIAHASGDAELAHERLEHAVKCSEPESILRPFVERRQDLLPLLVQHSVWGTDHEVFVAAVLAQHQPELVRRRERVSWTLSEREREVLIYMRSMLTAAEIADSLFVSVNTLKTHQRSIYRKLGVTSRRSAIRVAMSRGLI